MIKKFSRFILLLFIMLIITACSSEGSGDGPTNSEEPNNNNENVEDEGITFTYDSDLEGEITFWTWDGGMWPDVVEEFENHYPNIDVELVTIGIGDMHDRLQTTLSAGRDAPDVVQIFAPQFTRYQADGLLEDLLESPYDAGRFENDMSEHAWNRWRSVDGKQLIGMPWNITPLVFFYREDLYEQVGLPSDPEELGEFLQDPNNVITAAQTLEANDMYMFEFRDSPAIQYGDSVGYFDSDFNWQRNDDRMVELLDIVKQGVQIGWAPQMSVLVSDEGKELLKQGKVASFPGGINLSRQIEGVVPDQSGKWRVTRAPLGINVNMVGSTFGIPSQGENKEAAWAFTEWITRSEEAWKIYADLAVQSMWKHIANLPWVQEHENEFLGGQKDYKFYETLVDAIPVRNYSNLDDQAWPIYIESVNEAIDKNIDSKTTLQQIEDDALKQLAPEIEEMKEQLANE